MAIKEILPNFFRGVYFFTNYEYLHDHDDVSRTISKVNNIDLTYKLSLKSIMLNYLWQTSTVLMTNIDLG